MSLLESRSTYRPFVFPQAGKFTDLQRKNFWDAKKIVIAGDIQDYHTTFNTGTGNHEHSSVGGNETRPININVMWAIKY